MLEQLDEAAAFFEGSTLRDSTPYVPVNGWFFAARPV